PILDTQSQLPQQLLEAQPFALVVARRVVRLRPQAMEEPMRFLCRIGGHSGAASDVTDVTHVNIPPPSDCREAKSKRRAESTGSACARFLRNALLQVMSMEPPARG